MPPSKPVVLLPCEIKAREFESKLLLAGILAERGYRVLVGSRNHMHMALHRLPRGIYLGKDVRHSSKHIVRMLRLLGMPFLAQDEEALFFYSRASYRRLRVNDQVFPKAERLLAWGEENALAWREAESYKGAPISVTGNGRIDLLRPEFRSLYSSQVDALRVRYGRFLLVNTNFGALNHFFTNLTVLRPPEELDEGASPWETGLSRHRYALFRAFRALVPALAKRFPDHQIILRPHPGENHQIWKEAAGGAANVTVIHEGSAIPWLLASECVIHNGCTTGVEGFVLGAQPIVYQPAKSDTYDLALPNALGHQASTEEDIFQIIGDILAGRRTAQTLATTDRVEFLRQHIAATDGRFASELIADVIDGYRHSMQSISAAGLLSRSLGFAYSATRAGLKLVQRNWQNHKSNEAYTAHRFPKTGIEEVRDRVKELGRTLNRFAGVDVSEVSANIFSMVSDEGTASGNRIKHP